MRNKKQLFLSVLWSASLLLNVYLLFIFYHDVLTPRDDIAGDKRQKMMDVQKSGYKDERKISDFLSWDAAHKHYLEQCEQQRQRDYAEVMERVRSAKR